MVTALNNYKFHLSGLFGELDFNLFELYVYA